MPQLRIEFFSSQIFWLTICFLVLFLLFRFLFLPKIMFIINYRREQINSKLALAKINVYKIEDMENEYESKLKAINTKIEVIKAESRKDIQAEFDTKLRQATEEIDAKFFAVKKELQEQFDDLDVPSEAKQLFEKLISKIVSKDTQFKEKYE
ncbi:MAG: hypothetical protein K9G11_02555 [Rickettsiaceae bacterium]|nr:hypothetical protein [Rickettsiaceae bacterium]